MNLYIVMMNFSWILGGFKAFISRTCDLSSSASYKNGDGVLSFLKTPDGRNATILNTSIVKHSIRVSRPLEEE